MTVRLLTTWAAWAEIADTRNRATATAVLRNLTLADAARSLRSVVAAIAATPNHVFLRHQRPAEAWEAAAEVDRAEVVAEPRGVPAAVAAVHAVAAAVAVPAVAALRMVVTESGI